MNLRFEPEPDAATSLLKNGENMNIAQDLFDKAGAKHLVEPAIETLKVARSRSGKGQVCQMAAGHAPAGNPGWCQQSQWCARRGQCATEAARPRRLRRVHRPGCQGVVAPLAPDLVVAKADVAFAVAVPMPRRSQVVGDIWWQAGRTRGRRSHCTVCMDTV